MQVEMDHSSSVGKSGFANLLSRNGRVYLSGMPMMEAGQATHGKAAGGEIITGFAGHLSEPQLVGYRIPLGSIPSRAFPSCMDLSQNHHTGRTYKMDGF